MDKEKARSIAISAIVILLILAGIFVFLWGSVFNEGEIVLTGDAPFTVEILGEGKEQCSSSPCMLELTAGNKDLIFFKEGFQPIIENQTIKRFSELQLQLDFSIVPFTSEAVNYPASPVTAIYEFALDEDSGRQMLIDSTDLRADPLIFFATPLEDPQIISDDHFLVVFEPKIPNKALKINLKTKAKEEISHPDFRTIEWLHNSPSGDYMIFKENDSDSLLIMDRLGETKNLDLRSSLLVSTWTQNNTLIFISTQNYQKDLDAGNYANEINILDGEVLETIAAEYDPQLDTYRLFNTFPEITELPEEILVTGSVKELYFKQGGKNFKITLE